MERLLGLGVDLNPFYGLADADLHLTPSTGGFLYTFPEARVVADVTVADHRGLGFSASKARYLIGLAGVVSSGGLDLDGLDLMSREGAIRNLQRLHGIGGWSAEYVLLRGLGRLDVFPGDEIHPWRHDGGTTRRVDM